MPKKRHPIPYTKPQSSAHPSISRSNNSRNDDSSRDESDSNKCVNDLLQHLRISQASPVGPTGSRSDVNPKVLHPLVANILQIPATLPPIPRSGMRPFATPGRRRPPGPAAPRSWLENNTHAPTHARNHSTKSNPTRHTNLEPFDTLPDTIIPDRRSLQHLTLLHLAKDWEFHIEYDQYYLATLPVRTKQILLTYIARYSPKGISLNGLQRLFLSEHQLSNATGAEGLTHLDLAGSIGHYLSFKDLKAFVTTTFSAVLDSWDEEDDKDTATGLAPSPNSVVSTALTHLSLSHPPPNISWRSLLSLFPHLSTLTHLSLAFWPAPSLQPNSATAYLSTPAGRISYSPTNLYSHSLDRDFSGAASVLRQFSRQTYCLQYLDLIGCDEWLPALAWREGGIEWQGAWGGMRILRVGRGKVPESMEREDCGRRDSLVIQHYKDKPSDLDDLATWTSGIPRPHRLIKLMSLS